MRKKLAVLFIVFAAVAGGAALLSATPAQAKGCPPGSHLFTCNGYSFCCPNNALCFCKL